MDPISQCFDGCEIFITGGSGVVGRALVEKLLRSCNVRRIYLLMRNKREYGAEQRLTRLKSHKIFRTLCSTNAEAMDKLIAIPGDATLPNLGISPEYSKIMENVSIVYHCAATVRFDEPIRMAMKLNVGGTLEALKFAETLKKLKLFMHVSTFFSNTYLEFVDEKIYASPIDWKMLLNLTSDDSKEEILDFLTKKMITGFPNTYCFTKNLAETVVNEYRTRLPVVVYRPSIVLFAFSDPEPGWPPSLTGAMGLFTLVGCGLLKAVFLGSDVRLDITPQDIGVKCMLYYTMRGVQEYQKGIPVEAPVFMNSSYGHSTHTFRRMGEILESADVWNKAAFEKNLLLPSSVYTSCRFLYMFLVLTKQVLPAMLVDLLLPLFGRKPVVMSIARKAFVTLEVMKPFLFNNYMSKGVSEYDEIFKLGKGTPFDISEDVEGVDTDERLVRNCKRMTAMIREVLLNEDPSTWERSRKIIKIKQVIYQVIRAILAFYILRWLYRYLSVYITNNYL